MATPVIKLTNSLKGLAKSIHLNDPADAAEIYRGELSNPVLGSLLELPIKAITSIPGIKGSKAVSKYNDAILGFQESVINADRAAGEWLANKNPTLHKIFTTKDLLPDAHILAEPEEMVKITKAKGKPDVTEHFIQQDKVPVYIPTDVSRVTAPLSKTKNFVAPLAIFAGAESLINKPAKEEGVQSVTKKSEDNELLIEKVAEALNLLGYNDKLKQASEMLKQASFTVTSLEEKLASLTEDNKTLKLQLLTKERAGQAEKLAKEMVKKGMIKQADLSNQVDEITKMSEPQYEVLCKTVSDMPDKVAKSAGLDKIGFLLAEANDVSYEPPSLEDAIRSSVKKH